MLTEDAVAEVAAFGAAAPARAGATAGLVDVLDASGVRPAGFVAVAAEREAVGAAEETVARAFTGVVLVSVALGLAVNDGLDLAVEEARVVLLSAGDGVGFAAVPALAVPVVPVIRLDKPFAAGFFSSPDVCDVCPAS
jgi:cytosine/adenosine deaminase-related metal-dependent hydrolase